KTGTLTRGEPEVTDIIAISGTEDDVLKIAANVEKNSLHPLAGAVVKQAEERGIQLLDTGNFDTFGGKGVGASIDGKQVLIGTRALMSESNITLDDGVSTSMQELESQGKTVIIVSMAGSVLGLVAITDPLKPTSGKAIQSLKKMGLEVGMVTGDNSRTAKAIASQIGIDTVLSEVLPGDKAAEVRKLQDEGKVVAFVGDGINDAPALAQADVGIAIGSGTDVAIESGDIVLMKDDLLDAVGGIQLSRKVLVRIKQNLFWAFAYNSALIPVAAGILVPLAGIHFRPEFAGLAMAMSSVTVVSLSLMLRNYVPPASKME
ncbi:MAG: HAD-IC family P-type ATPase, partial [Thermoplasmata archaeon]|nr:HAD-IC family P-type ATPase [Thermoplasmata archaeon]